MMSWTMFSPGNRLEVLPKGIVPALRTYIQPSHGHHTNGTTRPSPSLTHSATNTTTGSNYLPPKRSVSISFYFFLPAGTRFHKYLSEWSHCKERRLLYMYTVVSKMCNFRGILSTSLFVQVRAFSVASVKDNCNSSAQGLFMKLNY